jgi:hypothetical protein
MLCAASTWTAAGPSWVLSRRSAVFAALHKYVSIFYSS